MAVRQVAEEPPKLNEHDLERQIGDLAARTEVASNANRRSTTLQRLLSKIVVLSDREFESAVDTLESLVDGYRVRKGEGSDSGKDKAKSADVVRDVERKLGGIGAISQIRGK